MKRVLTLILLLMLAAIAFAEDDFEATYFADISAASEFIDAATEEIESFSSILHGGVFKRVEINPNLGTDEGGDFIALVYMEYPYMSDPKADFSNITTASATISIAIKDTCPDAVELVVFWDLPRYDASAKVNFEPGENGWVFGDVMAPKVMIY